MKRNTGSINRNTQTAEKLLHNVEKLSEIKKITDPKHRINKTVAAALEKISEIMNQPSPPPAFLAEVKKYWIPIAYHFGIWKTRYSLEDRLFELTDKKNFMLMSSLVKKKQKIHEKLFKAVLQIVSHQLKKAGLSNYEITFRQKNIYGIYRKMKLKNKNINFMTDWFGIRIVVDTIPQCYKVLEVLHYLWPHYHEHFVDYIKTPKPNGYQSLHTILHCLDGQTVEFQIRTRKMDVYAEYGPAAHGIYKQLEL